MYIYMYIVYNGQEACCLSSNILLFPRKPITCFEYTKCSFAKVTSNQKVNYSFRIYDVFVQKYDFSKKANYLIRKYDVFVRIHYFLTKTITCFESTVFSFENMTVTKKVNYLFRLYDKFVRRYEL